MSLNIRVNWMGGVGDLEVEGTEPEGEPAASLSVMASFLVAHSRISPKPTDDGVTTPAMDERASKHDPMAHIWSSEQTRWEG